MRIRLAIFSCFFLLSQLSLLDMVISGKCLNDQRSLLLQLKQNLVIFPRFASNKNIESWDLNVDCCMWEGVMCNPHTGHVIGLNLSNCGIIAGINGSSSLFKLHKLERLNLSYNYMEYDWFPSEFVQLSRLTHLNLSHTSYWYQIPHEISRLTRLVYLDLSSTGIPRNFSSNSEKLGLEFLFQNLSFTLRELHLDGINMSTYNSEWCQALSSTLPNLRVLSLSKCNLQGPIHPSLSQLHFLSYLDLSGNNLSSVIPDFFANFSYLASLNLGSCELFGEVPHEIFKLPTLQKFDASYNQNLNVSSLEFPSDSALQVLDLSGTNSIDRLLDSIGSLNFLTVLTLRGCIFSAYFPSSIRNLTQSLHSLDLQSSYFSGSIPSWIGNLTQLHSLDLSLSYFSGSIPSWIGKLTQLHSLAISWSSFSGSIPCSIGNLNQLYSLGLSGNNLNGSIPFWIGNLSKLSNLDLSSNNFNGLIPPSIGNLTQLVFLDLSSNAINGLIPPSIGNLNRLTRLSLNQNRLTGPIPLSMFTLPSLLFLNLKENHLSGQLNEFENASSFLGFIHLGDNILQGQVPKSILKLPSLLVLVLASNNFTGVIDLHTIKYHKNLRYLNLSSNKLQGSIPIPPPFIQYLDYSNNNFTSTIPSNFGSNLLNMSFFSLTNNNLHGKIPASICNAKSLVFLDLSINHFTGSIPQCLSVVSVLILGGNRISGSISQTFFTSKCRLKTLDFNDNTLEGQVPQGLANCKDLEVLNLGNNHFNGSFPFWLETLSQLRVLVLRDNNFHGFIKHPTGNNSFPMLQIVDLSGNNFTGPLSPKWFQGLKAMMKQEIKFDFLRFEHGMIYYKDTVTVVGKGQELVLEKILTTFIAIDLSNNQFEGEIPEVIGDLMSLHILNLSHNHLTGRIPSAFGELGNLESLDLSQNMLSGNIPQQLSKLTFLAFLNLSSNHLVGKIPQGPQFQTFTETSFQGNLGLCGNPLPRSCKETTPEPRSSIPEFEVSESTSEIDWEIAWIGFACGEGMGVVGGIILGIVVCNKFLKKKGKIQTHRSIRQL